MKLSALLIFFFLNGTIATSQNLISNNSFEDLLTCPNYISPLPQYTIYSWIGALSSGSGICNECDLQIGPSPSYINYGVPQNIIGYQEPVSGVGYCVVSSLNPSPVIPEPVGKGFIYQKIREKFVANKKYHVGYYISLCDSVEYATPKFGAFFSADEPQFDATWPFLLDNMQCINTTQALTDKTIWYKLEWNYTAQGGEQYITIGNNTNLNQLDTVHVVGGGTLSPNSSYYYIDDVFVIPIKESNQKICSASANMQLQAIEQGTTYQWSTGDSTSAITVTQNGVYILLTTHDSLYRIDTFNVVLNHPTNPVTDYLPNEVYFYQNGSINLQGPPNNNYTYNWSNGATTQNTTVTESGIYTLQITAQDGCMAFDTCVVRYITSSPTNLPQGEAIKLYPNPANDYFIIDGLKNNTSILIELSNISGEIISNNKFTSQSNQYNYNTSHLKNGIYNIKIIDASNGVFVSKLTILK